MSKQSIAHSEINSLPVIPFTPQTASINRVRIVDLPGIDLDDGVAGEQAYNLLSAPAIVRYATTFAANLQLPQSYLRGDPDRPELRRDIPLFIDNSLSNSLVKVSQTAKDIARRLGRNLGYILLTLHRGDEVNRIARQEWTAREWEQWHHIRSVRIGGGIVSGRLGDSMIAAARELIADTGYGSLLQVSKTDHPRSMALIGASRYFPPDTHHALCLDMGQTSIKAAIAQFERGMLIRFMELSPKNVSWRWRNHPDAKNDIKPLEVVHFVTQEILEAWELTSTKGYHLDPYIMLSIAAYVREGELLGNGIYARMSLLTEDVRNLLSESIWREGKINAQIQLIHDGTAASALHAGELNTAVLVLGTAIGVGFAPESTKQLRTIHQDMAYFTL